MRFSFDQVGFGAIAISLIAVFSSTDGADAARRAAEPVTAEALEVVSQIKPGSGLEPAAPWSADTVDTLDNPPASPPAESPAEIEDVAPPRGTSLVALVAAQPRLSELPRELNCLAGAIYFEAKSESLTGQLAVGRVVVARSRSGRFPNSYCGVVFQPSQFSFVRGGGMPGIDRRSRQWRNAVAIAQISHAGTWRSPVEGALFFHATHVSPAWKRPRMARVENHIFYR